jgi:alkylation response protein AidB-like acyl-CoA dehydrogenase
MGALRYAVDYALERRAYGGALFDLQAIQFLAADLFMGIQAARFVTYRAADAVDRGLFGRESAALIATAKCLASDLAVKAASDCIQILGAAGYMGDHPLERHFRDARQLQIVEGTNQIQRLIVARAIRDGVVTI